MGRETYWKAFIGTALMLTAFFVYGGYRVGAFASGVSAGVPVLLIVLGYSIVATVVAALISIVPAVRIKRIMRNDQIDRVTALSDFLWVYFAIVAAPLLLLVTIGRNS